MKKSRVSEKERFVTSNSNDMPLFLFIEEQLKKSEHDWKVMSSLNKNENLSNENATNHAYTKINSDRLGETMITSFIPGHNVMDKNSVYLSEFTALCVDIRNSSTHFKRKHLSSKFESGLHRVFIEISTLLSAVTHIAEEKGGVATELLGDGALILLPMQKQGKEVIKDALYIANKIINISLKYINHVLMEKYNLQPLIIGIGISHSKAMIKTFNINGHYHPKVIAQCIWEATKLSNGNNKVFISSKSFSLLGDICMHNLEVKDI